MKKLTTAVLLLVSHTTLAAPIITNINQMGFTDTEHTRTNGQQESSYAKMPVYKDRISNTFLEQ